VSSIIIYYFKEEKGIATEEKLMMPCNYFATTITNYSVSTITNTPSPLLQSTP